MEGVKSGAHATISFNRVLLAPWNRGLRFYSRMTTLSTARGRSALAVSSVFTCLATILVLIRVYTRSVMVKQMGPDDYTIVTSLVRDTPGQLQHSIDRGPSLGVLMDVLRGLRRW